LKVIAEQIVGRTAPAQIHGWTDRDYMIYGLALGLGADPLDPATLPFVYERQLRVMPTFPTVLAWIIEPTFDRLGAHPHHALHSGQKIEIHRPLTGATTVSVTGRVVSVQDKGRERGALIVARQEIVDAKDGARIATLTTSCFARDGGGSGNAGDPVAPPHQVPAREPDLRIRYALRPDAALLYRLTGDRNPLHADPEAARAGGFERPILHGLCTFGMSCRAVLEGFAAWMPSALLSHEARFTAPVYPGETLEIALWRDNNTVSFQASVPDRGVTVLSNGKALLRQ
jgi:acyl dehydratase